MCRIEEAACHGASMGEVELLGSSGDMTAAVQRAMMVVEEVHQRDALMQYEGCFPHPDLTRVRAFDSSSSYGMVLAGHGMGLCSS